jgi:hypothetical protein
MRFRVSSPDAGAYKSAIAAPATAPSANASNTDPADEPLSAIVPSPSAVAHGSGRPLLSPETALT